MFARFFADKKEGKCLAVTISPQRTEGHKGGTQGFHFLFLRDTL